MNDMFRARFKEISSLPYSTRFEQEADAAIESWAYDFNAESWNKISPGAWRVLLERHSQAIMAASLGLVSGNFVIEIPAGLTEDQKRGALVLVWLHGMKLLFPVADRSRDELPASGNSESWKPH
jgi:hypothetical protein